MTITMYSTSTCSFCHILGKWLDAEGITYTKRVTDEDPAAMAAFLEVNEGSFAVPFTIVTDDKGNQTKITGYDRAKFKSVLNI